MEQILDHLHYNIPSLTWRLNPFDPDIQSLPLTPFQDDFTQVIDLAPGLPVIIKKWTKGHRSAIGQAQRSGVRIERAATVSDWQEYFLCYEDSRRRWGNQAGSPYSWQFFENVQALGPENVRLWLAKRDACILAGALCFYHNRHVVYWHGATYERFFKLRPANLLQYEIIKDAIDKKYSWYDFNPSGGHARVVSFKKSFGASTRSCPLFHSETSWRRCTEALSRIIGRGKKEHHVQSD
jgi:lipid II:glycine glycyltransferase (peptidoglycan interpeptide bridge formation enzyme)